VSDQYQEAMQQDGEPRDKYLHRVLELRGYNLVWRIDASDEIRAGDMFGGAQPGGYRTGMLNGRPELAHKLTYEMFLGPNHWGG
jgi:hypothetical protein